MKLIIFPMQEASQSSTSGHWSGLAESAASDSQDLRGSFSRDADRQEASGRPLTHLRPLDVQPPSWGGEVSRLHASQMHPATSLITLYSVEHCIVVSAYVRISLLQMTGLEIRLTCV